MEKSDWNLIDSYLNFPLNHTTHVAPCTHSLTPLHWRVPHSRNPFSLSIECQMQCQQSEFRAHLWEDLYLSFLRTNHPFGWREKPGKGEKGLSKHKKKSEFHSLNCLEARKENLCSTVPDTAVLPYARCFFPLLRPYIFSVFSPSNSGIWILETAFFSRMNVSHASVHPVEDPPPTDAINAPRVRMKDFQGTPGTTGGLSLRCCQFLFAAIALCVMVTTSDFSSVTAFW